MQLAPQTLNEVFTVEVTASGILTYHLSWALPKCSRCSVTSGGVEGRRGSGLAFRLFQKGAQFRRQAQGTSRGSDREQEVDSVIRVRADRR